MHEPRGVWQGGERRDGEVPAAKGERQPGEHGAAGQYARAAAEDGFVVTGMPLDALDCHGEETIEPLRVATGRG